MLDLHTNSPTKKTLVASQGVQYQDKDLDFWRGLNMNINRTVALDDEAVDFN